MPIPNPQPAPDVARVRAVVEELFPGLWPAVDAGLAVAATLLLEANANPVALVYVGGPSSSKTTVADMFTDHPRCYRSDSFTPAAFVSQAANRGTKELASVDLLPRIKHKVLITPELAPIFRGKPDDLSQRFAIITRVLDGEGLLTDSGTHGQRGYRGDYLFAWLGCTTPFEPRVWQVMAQLGSRLFFFGMDDRADCTVDDLVASDQELPYRRRMERCRKVVQGFLTELFTSLGGVRGVMWDTAADPESVRQRIAQLAYILAAMRSEPVREGGVEVYAPGKRELPRRAYAVLSNLGRGHALVHGRRQLSEDDLPFLAHVVVSSMPTERSRVFVALVLNGGEPLSVSEVQSALGVRHPDTARRVMADLDRLGVAELVKGVGTRPDCLQFRPEWQWCSSPELAAMLLATKNRGVCAAPTTSDLAEHENEKKREGMEEVPAHSPQEMVTSDSTDRYAMFDTPCGPIPPELERDAT